MGGSSSSPFQGLWSALTHTDTVSAGCQVGSKPCSTHGRTCIWQTCFVFSVPSCRTNHVLAFGSLSWCCLHFISDKGCSMSWLSSPVNWWWTSCRRKNFARTRMARNWKIKRFYLYHQMGNWGREGLSDLHSGRLRAWAKSQTSDSQFSALTTKSLLAHIRASFVTTSWGSQVVGTEDLEVTGVRTFILGKVISW